MLLRCEELLDARAPSGSDFSTRADVRRVLLVGVARLPLTRDERRVGSNGWSSGSGRAKSTWRALLLVVKDELGLCGVCIVCGWIRLCIHTLCSSHCRTGGSGPPCVVVDDTLRRCSGLCIIIKGVLAL